MPKWCQQHATRTTESDFLALARALSPTQFELAKGLYRNFRDDCLRHDRDSLPLTFASCWLMGNAKRALRLTRALINAGILDLSTDQEVRDPRLAEDCVLLKTQAAGRAARREAGAVLHKTGAKQAQNWPGEVNDFNDLANSVRLLEGDKNKTQPSNAAQQEAAVDLTPDDAIAAPPDEEVVDGVRHVADPAMGPMDPPMMLDSRQGAMAARRADGSQPDTHHRTVEPVQNMLSAANVRGGNENPAPIRAALPIAKDDLADAIIATRAWAGSKPTVNQVMAKLRHLVSDREARRAKGASMVRHTGNGAVAGNVRPSRAAQMIARGMELNVAGVFDWRSRYGVR